MKKIKLTDERRKQLREFAVYLNNQYKLGVFTKEKAVREFRKKLYAFDRVANFECTGFGKYLNDINKR